MTRRLTSLFIFLLAICSCAKQASTQTPSGKEAPRITVRIATYNIRCLSSADTDYKSWEFRKGNVARMVKDRGFEIIGFQEVSEGQVSDLKGSLPEFDFLLIGRNDGATKGESVGIAWLKERFTAVKTGRFFLSATPDVVSSPYPEWTSTDPGRNRVVAWAELKEKESGRSMLIFSTHFEVGKTDDAIIRLRSAELVVEREALINTAHLPFVLVGDLNSKSTDACQEELRKSFTDAFMAANEAGVREGCIGSSNGHNYTENYLDNNARRIDYIYYKGDIDIRRYRVCNETYEGYYPSDHCPVLADLTL